MKKQVKDSLENNKEIVQYDYYFYNENREEITNNDNDI
jgi:hypothetical protein